MSDTAKELLAQFRKDVYDEILASLLRREASRYSLEHIAENVTHEIMKHVGPITKRIEQLERGIERANDQAVKCLGGWADMGPATVAPVSYDTLMQLIEELANHDQPKTS